MGLGRSIQLNSPTLESVCVVEGNLTDAERGALEKCYSQVVPIRAGHLGLGWQVKNVMIEYSPFEHTLFLDSDCLVLQDLRAAFAEAGERDIAFATKAEPTQETGAFLFAKIDLAQLKQEFHVDWWPQILGGGHFFFRRTPTARNIFRRALDWSQPAMLAPFGWTDFKRGAPDELTLQMALAEAGHARACALVAFPLICWTPWESARPDIFRRRISLTDRESGAQGWVGQYFVAHYGGEGLARCTYRRELWRLRLWAALPRVAAARLTVNLAKPGFHLAAWSHSFFERAMRRLASLGKVSR